METKFLFTVVGDPSVVFQLEIGNIFPQGALKQRYQMQTQKARQIPLVEIPPKRNR